MCRQHHLFQLKIPGQQQLQTCIRVCHQALRLVEDGLFQRIAGHTAVAVRGGILGLLAVKNR